MASNVTLASLRAQSRATADMQNSGFVTPEEHDQYINLAAQTLYDILVSRYEDYYMANPLLFTVLAPNPLTPEAVAETSLPADFYKLRGVDVQDSGSQWAPMRAFTFQERNTLQNPLLLLSSNIAANMYRLRANKLQILGVIASPFVGRMWYIPKMNQLVAPTDTFDGVNGWERHIIISVAIMMKQKEESDVSVLMVELEKIEDRIRNMADNRDAGAPERVTDVSGLGWGPVQRF